MQLISNIYYKVSIDRREGYVPEKEVSFTEYNLKKARVNYEKCIIDPSLF